MDSSDQAMNVSFEEAVLKAKVAQIADYVGYHAITRDSSNILVDLYRRTIYHLARHCKDAANNNRRIEPTTIDLVQAYNFVGISIPELQEHIETVKIPLELEIAREERVPPLKGIQRNLLVDDLLEAEKKGNQEDGQDDDKAASENGVDEEEKPSVPLLKETYEELASKFSDCTPVSADKNIRLGGRILLIANTNDEFKKSHKEVANTRAGDSKETLKTVLPIIEDKIEEQKLEESVIVTPKPAKQPRGKKKMKKVKKTPEFAIVTETVPLPPEDRPPKKITKQEVKIEPASSSNETKPEKTAKGKRQGRKKIKIAIAPIEPIPIESAPTIEPKVEKPKSPEPIIKPPTPVKQPKGKKKKKSSNQFAIVTETVAAAPKEEQKAEEKEWLCPACGKPDDGDLMVECDTCKEWYHLSCTRLKKPPEDDENWECDFCNAKAKAKKRPQTPIEAVKMKTPEPIPVSVITSASAVLASAVPRPTTTVEAPTFEPPVVASGSSQDDLCPECNLPDDGTMMIQCDDPFCAKWFHGKCVNLLEEPKEDESWFCKVCVDKQQSAFKRRRRAK